MKIYQYTYLICGLLLCIANFTDCEDNDICKVHETTLTCNSVPRNFPETIEHVYIADLDLENEELEFDSQQWANVTTLDIQSDVGVEFRNRNKPIFKNLTNLKTLGIHAVGLGQLDQETFVGLPKLQTLDLSYSIGLPIQQVKNSFVLSTALENLQNLDISSIESNPPIVFDELMLDILSRRRIKSLNISGLAVAKIVMDIDNVRSICSSIHTLNLSKCLYAADRLDIQHTNHSIWTEPVPCTSLKTVDLSHSYMTGVHIFRTIMNDADEEIDIAFDLSPVPSLETAIADNLNFRHPIQPFILTVQGKRFNCTKCNFSNLRKFYARGNHIKWMNASCIGCGTSRITVLDFSSNGLEYLSPGFLRDVITLEEINLGDNQLHVMEAYREFEDVFATFSKLRKLSLYKNDLQSLPKYIFKNNIKLEYLDLSRNSLMTLSFSLRNLKNLRYLDLSHNKISLLNDIDFEQFSQFVQERFEDYNNSFSLEIGSNSFRCTCDGYRFINWIYVYLTPKLGWNKQFTCVKDNDVIEVDHNAVTESQYQCHRTVSMIATSALSVCLLVAITITSIVLVVFLRRRRRLQRREEFVYKLKNDRAHHKYLCHIIYCSKDDILVQENIKIALYSAFNQLTGLNDNNLVSAGFRGYRLGHDVYCEAEATIRLSYFVVYLVSTNSCCCIRCRRELQLANNGHKTIAVIKLEEVQQDDIPPLLSNLMTSAVTASFVRAWRDVHMKPTAIQFCKAVLDKTIANLDI